MARLTWQDVNAPNFAPAIAGVETAANLIGNAVRAGQQGIANFTKNRTDNANRAVLSRLLGIGSSDEIQGRVADGSLLGSDGQFVSESILEAIGNREGQLLRNDNLRTTTANAAYEGERLQDVNQRGDSASDAVNGLIQRAATGEVVNFADEFARNPALSNLTLDQRSKVLDDVAGLQNQVFNQRISEGELAERKLDGASNRSLRGTQQQAAQTRMDIEAADRLAKQRGSSAAIADLPSLVTNSDSTGTLTQKDFDTPEEFQAYVNTVRQFGFNPLQQVDLSSGSPTLATNGFRDNVTGNQVDALISTLNQATQATNVPVSVERYNQDAKDGSTPLEVATRAAGKGGTFEGADNTALAQRIQAVMQESPNVNAAQALSILENSAQDDWLGSFGENLGNDRDIDDDAAETLGTRFSNGTLAQDMSANGIRARIADTVKARNDAYVEAGNRLIALTRENRIRGGALESQVQQAERAAERAKATLEKALQDANKDLTGNKK